jgi:hypothetical protein
VTRRLGLLVAALALVAVAASCGSSGDDSTGATATTTTEALRVTYGPQPSESAKMICAREAQDEIAGSLGVKTSTPPVPKWANHTYSCDYVYPNGVIKLSVHEVPSIAAARAAFRQLGVVYGRTGEQATLGQGAFYTRNKSMVVVKDNKVMFVDTSGIPDQFGKPPLSRSDVGLTVAVTVMGCWTGA